MPTMPITTCTVTGGLDRGWMRAGRRLYGTMTMTTGNRRVVHQWGGVFAGVNPNPAGELFAHFYDGHIDGNPTAKFVFPWSAFTDVTVAEHTPATTADRRSELWASHVDQVFRALINDARERDEYPDPSPALSGYAEGAEHMADTLILKGWTPPTDPAEGRTVTDPRAEAWEAGMAAAKLQAAGIKPARNPYQKEIER